MHVPKLCLSLNNYLFVFIKYRYCRCYTSIHVIVPIDPIDAIDAIDPIEPIDTIDQMP